MSTREEGVYSSCCIGSSMNVCQIQLAYCVVHVLCILIVCLDVLSVTVGWVLKFPVITVELFLPPILSVCVAYILMVYCQMHTYLLLLYLLAVYNVLFFFVSNLFQMYSLFCLIWFSHPYSLLLLFAWNVFSHHPFTFNLLLSFDLK